MAESANKPLYMVSAGDLGTDPARLEKKLSDMFQEAAKWDAILLLDEADVFLQDRDYENLTRNALVSSKCAETVVFPAAAVALTKPPPKSS